MGKSLVLISFCILAGFTKANQIAEIPRDNNNKSNFEKVLKHDEIGFCEDNNIMEYKIDDKFVINLLDAECEKNNQKLLSYYTKNEIYQNGFEFYDNCVDSINFENNQVKTGKIDLNFSFYCTSNLNDAIIVKHSKAKSLVKIIEKSYPKVDNNQRTESYKEFESQLEETLQPLKSFSQNTRDDQIDSEFGYNKLVNKEEKIQEQFESCSLENLKILSGEKFKQYQAVPDLIKTTLDICDKAKNENLVLTGFGNPGSWTDNSVSISFSNLDSIKKKDTHAVVQGGGHTEYFKKQDLGEGGWSNNGVRFTRKYDCDDFTKPSYLTNAVSTKSLFDKSNKIVYDEESLFASNRYAKKIGSVAKRILDSNLFCRIANGVDPNTVMKDYYFDLGKLRQDKLDANYNFIRERQKEIYCGTNPNQRYLREKEGYPKFTCEKEFKYYTKKGLERVKEYERDRIEQGIEQNAEIKKVQEEVKRQQEYARNLNTRELKQYNKQNLKDNKSFSSVNSSKSQTINNYNLNKTYDSYNEQIEKTNISAKDYSNKLFNSLRDPKMQQAILFFNQAQFHFLNALGEKEAALATKKYAESLSKGSLLGKDNLKKILVQTQEHQRIINKKMKNRIILNEESKNELKKGFPFYINGIKVLVQLGFESYSLVNFIKTGSGDLFGKLLSGLSLAAKLWDAATAVPLFFSSTGDILNYASFNEINDIDELEKAKDSLGA